MTPFYLNMVANIVANSAGQAANGAFGAWTDMRHWDPDDFFQFDGAIKREAPAMQDKYSLDVNTICRAGFCDDFMFEFRMTCTSNYPVVGGVVMTEDMFTNNEGRNGCMGAPQQPDDSDGPINCRTGSTPRPCGSIEPTLHPAMTAADLPSATTLPFGEEPTRSGTNASTVSAIRGPPPARGTTLPGFGATAASVPSFGHMMELHVQM